ncbi:MAG: tRNA 5-methoxyuridine(34)/uridine 5-oxyacetic acid(34) synthase CmoB [Proteobacteria bacterium]|nr:tRNA 5-methoxyuridine(34)/uridine 5-oxyacetic acid(34) synthase CmoB [Pseudomonadota bacterium]
MNYEPLIERWLADPLLQAWAQALPAQIEAGFNPKRYGDLQRWRGALESLPDLPAGQVHLDQSAVGVSGSPLSSQQAAALEDALRGLHPWRKGPFRLFDIEIDTEWRSDWKWDRVQPHLDTLTGKRVLDIGCGSGYHAWRMLGAGASEVIGIEPTPLFVLQFWAVQRYIQAHGISVLPLGIEHIPPQLRAFDTVFSMGLLYHRRSPFDHLVQLRDCLTDTGELVLETLVVEGDENTVFVPPGRYARMGNVWCIPSPEALSKWLKKVGFKEVSIVDITVTTVDEQRQTSWMQFHSLSHFLDPNDPSKTIEGHPAPMRAILIAKL